MYEDLTEKQTCETIEVDFSLLAGTFFQRNHMKEMSDSLKEIRRDLHRLAEGSARVNVATQTIDQRRSEREEDPSEQGIIASQSQSTRLRRIVGWLTRHLRTLLY